MGEEAAGRARGRGRRVAALVGAVGVVVLAAACQTGVWMGDGDGRSVSVIGDSLVYQSEGNINGTTNSRLLADELVAEGYRAHVSGWIGHTVAGGHQDLWPRVGEPDLDVLVIALGTNDAHNAIPLEESRAALEAWLAETDDVGCVALVGINEQAYAWGLDVVGPAFNQMLAEEAAQHRNGIYVPWVPDLDVHGHDGDVHFSTDAAAAQYRATLHHAVDQCAATLGDPASTTTTTEASTTTTTEAPTTTTTEAPTTTTTGPATI